MPPSLIKSFIGLAARENSGIEKAAFVIDIRGGEFFADVKTCLDDLHGMGITFKLIFLEAAEEVLIRRFNETRREHPLSGGFSTSTGIRKEKEALDEIRNLSDFIIDTSNMKSMRLQEEIKQIFATEKEASDFTVNIESFGYKNGIPLDADMVLDMRFIPNPYYVAALKKLTGNNRKVRDYIMRFKESADFIEKVDGLINDMIPYYIREGKYHLNVAFGCTGGQHRSVAMANIFAERFSAAGRRITVLHRDL